MIKMLCAARGCGQIQPCPVHRRSTLRYGNRWRRFRLHYLREHPLCVRCEQRGITRAAREVDHIVPLPDDVRTDADPRVFAGRFQALCSDCHKVKTREDQRG